MLKRDLLEEDINMLKDYKCVLTIYKNRHISKEINNYNIDLENKSVTVNIKDNNLNDVSSVSLSFVKVVKVVKTYIYDVDMDIYYLKSANFVLKCKKENYLNNCLTLNIKQFLNDEE